MKLNLRQRWETVNDDTLHTTAQILCYILAFELFAIFLQYTTGTR